jgi:putative methylase
MKKKNLEILLQKIPKTVDPKPGLEQYTTSAVIASDILFNAYQFGDIDNKIVVDLGCGTGVFAIGAFILGAKKVYGFDVDVNVIKIAKQYSNQNKMDIDFNVSDVKDVNQKCDTVIMNPPFGAQKSNLQADRKFIEKAFEISDIIYSIHLKKTISFLEKMISSLNGNILFQKDYNFPVKWMFDFHKKEIKNFETTLLRINTNQQK